MRRLNLPLGLSVIAFTLTATAVARPDLNSFVNRKVTDTKSLVNQINSDPVVADRYQRHFGMTRQEVVAYVSNLHRGALPETGTYTIYSVPDAGYVKMHTAKLKKGEPMFLDPSNRPILIAKCGNPVVMGPSDVRKGNPMAFTPTGDSSTREFTEVVPREASPEGEATLVAMIPPVPEVVPTTIVPVTPVPAAPMTMVPVTATGGGFNGLPFLGALPLLLPFIGGGDGNGGGTQAVPEPATMVALGLGAVALIRRRRA
ncbi:PEP-CTERM sorting domain-containing protein [bacterium]|nr:MAG: PEP-CTERM sorting domain-containing protein [bacterium]